MINKPKASLGSLARMREFGILRELYDDYVCFDTNQSTMTFYDFPEHVMIDLLEYGLVERCDLHKYKITTDGKDYIRFYESVENLVGY